MDESRVRSLFRDAMVQTLTRVPAAPSWEDLEVRAAGAKTGQTKRMAPIGVALVVLALVTSLMIVGDTAPIGGDAPAPSFDAPAAAEAGQAWWLAVIEGDLGIARAISHPDAEFNYPGLMVLVGGFMDPTVSIQDAVFGTPVQPQLCFSVAGSRSLVTGSLVFRLFGDEWMLWEVRTGVERCGGLSDPSTTSSTSGITPRTTELLTSGAIPVRELMIPLHVLAVGPNLVLLDFDKGVLTVYPPGTHRLPRIAVDGAVGLPSGSFVVWTQGVASLFLSTLDGDVIEIGPRAVRHIEGFAPALRVVPSPDGTLAWLVQPGLITRGGEIYPTLVELVELPSGTALGSFEVDPNAFPIGATSSGLILNVQVQDGLIIGPGVPTGTEELVLLLAPDGSVVPVHEGSAIAVSASEVVVLSGEHLFAVPPLGGDGREVPKPVPGSWIGVGGPGVPSDAMPLLTVSPDGSGLLVGLVAGAGSPYTATVYVVELGTGTTTAISESLTFPPLATWSRDGEWIVLIDQRDIELIRRSNPTDRYLLAEVVPAYHWVLAAG